eukprot:gene2849-5686_t
MNKQTKEWEFSGTVGTVGDNTAAGAVVGAAAGTVG